MPNYDFGRCDGDHEKVDLQLRRAPLQAGFHDRSVVTLLTGSSHQRLNGFIGSRRIKRARFIIPRHGGNFPCRAERNEKLGPLPPSILNGNSLNSVLAKKDLPPAYPRLKRAGGRWCSNENRLPAQ